MVLQNYNAGISLSLLDNAFAIIFCGSSTSQEKIATLFEAISNYLLEIDGTTLSVGIGPKVYQLAALNSSYQNALKALEHSFYTGPNTLIHSNDVVAFAPSDLDYDYELSVKRCRDAIEKHLKLGEEEVVSCELEELYTLYSGPHAMPQEYTKGKILELIITLYQSFSAVQPTTTFFSTYTDTVKVILSALSLGEVFSAAKDFILSLTAYMAQSYEKHLDEIVGKTKHFIHQNLSQNITLNDIAQQVYLSPNYVGALFKKKTDQTINEYIMALRMKQACQLLTTTNLKIKEIAEQLGYDTPNYFSYSFKKQLHYTPQEYRTLHQ